MTAVQQAADLIRAGRSPALAIHVAAREHGTTTTAVVAGLAWRRSRRHRMRIDTPQVRRWWEE